MKQIRWSRSAHWIQLNSSLRAQSKAFGIKNLMLAVFPARDVGMRLKAYGPGACHSPV
jgi:hypothetical protein